MEISCSRTRSSLLPFLRRFPERNRTITVVYTPTVSFAYRRIQFLDPWVRIVLLDGLPSPYFCLEGIWIYAASFSDPTVTVPELMVLNRSIG
ncbi:hypothetical protein CDAR_538501 [Caerostris darwini]|uniref:Uncharacterized protein n=1 Tax=Caerostris darwini TaxID=1538125 RepID=A0AAV4UCS7_9ARAC|nr:hypothetical protein CDAR_538501 [Caerostris darwini]